MGIELNLNVQNDKSVRLQTRGFGQSAQEQAGLDELTLDTVEVFQKWVRVGKISDRKELVVLGSHLYRILFNGEVETFFRLKLNEVPKGERLRLLLSFDEKAHDLASLPWEYLYYPDTQVKQGFFFSTNVDLVLSRYMPLEQDRESLSPDESPLRVLIAVSKPEDATLGPVVASPVVDAIKKLTERYPVKVDVLEKPTINNFFDELEARKPHVLHFIGHGRFVDRVGKIAMLDAKDEKSVAWVEDQQFAELFTSARTIPRLVFLHLCESAAVDFTANFAGLAPKLIRAKVQAVVAMQYPITNRAAIDFSRAFYRGLAEGKPIDDAVQEGRRMITMNDAEAYNSRIFGTPVLYMRSYDGIIKPVVETQQSLSRPGKTDTAAATVGAQEMTTMHDVSQTISRVKAAAYTEAARKELDIVNIVSVIDGTDLGKDIASIRQNLRRRLGENIDSEMDSVYAAMLGALEK